MADRVDAHRPGAIVPADYRYLMSYHAPLANGGFFPIPAFQVQEALAVYAERGVGIHGGIFSCDVCGAHFKEGDLWEHTPTGEVIALGHTCADKYEMLADRGDYEREKAADALRAEREWRAAESAKARAAVLAETPGLEEALKTKHHIVEDIRGRFERFGSLSPKQIALVMKLAREVAEREAREAAEAAIPVAEVPTSRVEVEATILGTRFNETPYGLTEKMLIAVDTPSGRWKAWGTVPKALGSDLLEQRAKMEREVLAALREAIEQRSARLRGAELEAAILELKTEAGNMMEAAAERLQLRGARVRLTATFKPSQDRGFAFFSRPSGAMLLDA